jgi:hypothetical protein
MSVGKSSRELDALYFGMYQFHLTPLHAFLDAMHSAGNVAKEALKEMKEILKGKVGGATGVEVVDFRLAMITWAKGYKHYKAFSFAKCLQFPSMHV